MKNDDTQNGDSQTAKELNPIRTTVQANPKTNRSKKSTTQADKSQKWTIWRTWKQAPTGKQVKWVAEGIIILTGLGVLSVYIWDHLQREKQFRAEHRPSVVNTRPPKIQFFACNPPEFPNEIITGNINTFVKNVGTAVAKNVSPYGIQMRVIPETKTGTKFIDEPPPVTDESCRHRMLSIPGTEFSLDPGRESGTGMRQSAHAASYSIKHGEVVYFYLVSCVYYSEESGAEHGTCDRYRLHIPVKQTPFGIDNIAGTPAIPCDGSYVSGQFLPDVVGHCEE